MPGEGFTPAQWLVLVEHELLLFAGLFFLLGALDELAVDLIWVWLRIIGRGKSERLMADQEQLPLSGRAAVFIPAWREEAVIEVTVRHALDAWPQADMRLYVGCYPNDPATAHAAHAGADGDARLRVVIHVPPGSDDQGGLPQRPIWSVA